MTKKEHTMNRLSFGTGVFVVLAMLVVGASAVLAQDTHPASVMHDFSITFIDDPDAALALLADDVTIQIVPPPPGQSGVWNGIYEARSYFDFIELQNAQRELVGEWEVEGTTVRGTVMVTANQLVAWGVAPVEHVLEATVEDGTITSWSSTMTPAEQERVAAARDAVETPQGVPATGSGPGAGETVPIWALVTIAAIALSGALALRWTLSRAT
jgi:hypothetical protein